MSRFRLSQEARQYRRMGTSLTPYLTLLALIQNIPQIQPTSSIVHRGPSANIRRKMARVRPHCTRLRMLWIYSASTLELVHRTRAPQVQVTAVYVYMDSPPAVFATRTHCLVLSPLTSVSIAAKLQVNPNPTAFNITCWALELKIPEADAFRLVAHLLPEEIKEWALFEHSVCSSFL